MMDFGGVVLDGLVMSSSDNHSNNSNAFFPTTSSSNSYPLVSSNSDLNAKPKWYESGTTGGLGFKQERSAQPTTEDEFWRDLKMAKTSGDSSAFLRSNNSTTSLSHSDGQHMLSFSSPASTMAYFPTHNSSPAYARNTGYGSSGGGFNMHGVLNKSGPFTPSQWMELEHQALIYKYLTANAPIPSNLILPIRKALESAAYSSYPGSHFRHNPYGWGAFQLGFSGSSDPEPGRCRRTDGKKWRCSRDAVVDQKYCERHMNRGRHRSRKPVEGQTGQSAASAGKPTSAATTKLLPTATVVSTGDASKNLSHLQQHHLSSSRQSGAPNLTVPAQLDRGFVKQQQNPSQDFLSQSEFGLVCSNSLLNPLHKSTSSSLINSPNYPASSRDLNDHETKSQNSLRQFMDDWPHSDRTQLSISIPISSSDFMSSTSSPTNEKLALSPLRLSRELDPTQMGLGMGSLINEPDQQRQQANNWIPISWETSSMGGPLGEVLHSTTTNSGNGGGESKNVSSPLHLLNESSWDNSPRMGLSPTGVLQKTTFGSLSNSSAGSSPRNENNNLVGSTSVITNSSSSSMPAATM